MVEFQKMAITFTIMLFIINGFMTFATYLPQDGNNDKYLDFGIGTKEKAAIETQITQFYSDTNTLNPPIGDQVIGSTTQNNYLDIFKSWLLGATGLSVTLFKYIGTMAFGYFAIIDLFINPAWGFGMNILGSSLKFFFFVIQLFGIYTLVQMLFSIGTGYRTQM